MKLNVYSLPPRGSMTPRTSGLNQIVTINFISKFCQPKPNFIDFQFSVRFYDDVYIGDITTTNKGMPCDISTLQR